MPGSLPPGTILSHEHQVLSKTPVRSRIRYELKSYPDYVQGIDEAAASIENHLRLPANNPRTRALAEQWRRESGGGEAIVRRMLDHIR